MLIMGKICVCGSRRYVGHFCTLPSILLRTWYCSKKCSNLKHPKNTNEQILLGFEIGAFWYGVVWKTKTDEDGREQISNVISFCSEGQTTSRQYCWKTALSDTLYTCFYLCTYAFESENYLSNSMLELSISLIDIRSVIDTVYKCLLVRCQKHCYVNKFIIK